MRNPKMGKKKGQKPPQAVSFEDEGPSQAMDADDGLGGLAQVWRPGIHPIGEDEELDYDPTAYDCLHKFTLEWPCLSFDLIRDGLGGPRSTFPHTVFMVAGTQAANPRQNYIAILKLAALGQGRHGKRDPAKADDDSDDESSTSSSSDEGEDGEDMDASDTEEDKEPPARMHFRLLPQSSGTNRLRCMPQRPGVIAMWEDNGQVRILDASAQLAELEQEEQPKSKAAARVQVNPLQSHKHAAEGFAVDWSPTKPGRLATGDCKKHIHVWDPQEGGRWQVSSPYVAHTASVEDLQWSPSEETVFATCSVDQSIKVWDTRERSRAMLSVSAHDSDVNVISWNRLVTYMLASGGDDGSLRIWDLRAFSNGGFVSHFTYHRGPVCSVEWSPYEGSMLATTSDDNQLAVWDLALERDPEEEAALAPEGNAAAPEDLPAQLLFMHAGITTPKELHWHEQIPGMLACTAASGFDIFRPSNL